MKKKIVSLLLSLALVVTACGTIGFTGAANVSAADASTYLIKVNKQTNVVTVYKNTNGKYKAYRAMICSTGGSKTPSGTFHLQRKYRWHTMYGPCWAQYCTVINADYLFHSVQYYQDGNNATCYGAEYNKLGTGCSHGCVRMAVIDAKWIYENCPAGTKVKIFSSKSKGPLGKPKALKVKGKKVWDPTDPDKNNPDFRLKKPVISIYDSTDRIVKKTVSYSKTKKVNLLKHVSASNPNCIQDLTGSLKMYRLEKKVNGKWQTIELQNSLMRNRSGKYRIAYKVKDKYCSGTAYSRLILTIEKKPEPQPGPEPDPDLQNP